MKKLAVFLSIMIATLAFGQARVDDFGKEQLRESKVSLNVPIELKLLELNGWAGGYTERGLLGIVAEMVLDELKADLASSTWEILNEGDERDALTASRWVDTSSRRFDERTLKPGQIAFEIVCGGSNSGSSRIDLGYAQIETGSASAFIAITVKDLASGIVSGKNIGVIRGEAKYSSTNIEGLSVPLPFKNRPWFDYQRWGSDPEFRKGVIATVRALEDLRKKLRKLNES